MSCRTVGEVKLSRASAFRTRTEISKAGRECGPVPPRELHLGGGGGVGRLKIPEKLMTQSRPVETHDTSLSFVPEDADRIRNH